MQFKSRSKISKRASSQMKTTGHFYSYLTAILLTLTPSANACGPPYLKGIHPASCIQTSGCNEHTLEGDWDATLLYFGSGNFCTEKDERAFRSMYRRANRDLLFLGLTVIAFILSFTLAWRYGALFEHPE